jgi:2'-hydroxyisoflavone reductase
MASILVLGGTGFVGRHITEAALAAGHDVTLFNRGKTNDGLFPGVERRTGDRYEGDLAELGSGSWDGVIDVNAYRPEHVRSVVDVLGDRAGWCTFISTGSVYRHSNDPTDESSPLHTRIDESTDEIGPNYGPLKVQCEEEVVGAFGERCTIIRPGIVAGPHDPTERFTHWVRAAASGGEVVAARPEQPVQVIHGRDQADFVVAVTAGGIGGTFNTTGPTEAITMSDLLAACFEAAGTEPKVRWASEEEVAAEGLQLPLHLPAAAGVDGLFAASNARAVSAGLVNRALVDTAADTLEWARAHPVS